MVRGHIDKTTRTTEGKSDNSEEEEDDNIKRFRPKTTIKLRTYYPCLGE
jgi:hypothetical protein